MKRFVGKAWEIARQAGVRILVGCGCQFAFWKTMNRVLVYPSMWRFQRLAKDTNTIDGAIDLAFSFRHHGVAITPFQIREEIAELLQIGKELGPRVVLEIGTASGGTLFLLTRVATVDADVLSVDLPEGEFGGGYPAWKSSLFRSFAREGQKVHLIRADSHSPETLNEVRKILDGRPVDFLFIDGDHTYEGVRRDFEMYSPLVREGGVIAFHDICQGPIETVGGVPDFWQEISAKRTHTDIVKDCRQGGYGIGVLNQ